VGELYCKQDGVAVTVERVFNTYRRKFVWRAAVGLVAAVQAAILLGILIGGPLGFVTAVLCGGALLNRVILTGNRWVREQTEAKLRQVGELSPPGRTRFVGLAHPAYADDLERRQIESDDDVGFLTLGRDALAYRGDAMSFDVPYEQIGEIAVTNSTYAPWPRLQIEILDGEPFDAIIIDSRDAKSFRACQQDGHRLREELQAVVDRIRRHGGQRLHAEASDDLLADA
jgi:hypothetical protein